MTENLTLTEFTILAYIMRHENQNLLLADFMRVARCKSSTASRTVIRLHKDGFIWRDGKKYCIASDELRAEIKAVIDND